MISWNNPKFGDRELELVGEVLKSGYVSEGPKTKELEEKLSKICHVKHIIMTTSATSALYLAIEADKRIREYSKGKVIIPNLTFVATYNAVKMANLEVDIQDVQSRYLIDTFQTLPETKIIIPVNLLGRTPPCRIDLTDNRHQTFIFDNAGCLGSNVSNGKVGCYSLQANKLLTCGQGGFCATDDDEYAKVIRQIKDFGREDKYQNDTEGFNFKFNDIQAAVVLGQLENINNRKEMHIHQYNRYRDALSSVGEFVEFGEGEIPLWVEFITPQRDKLYDYLKSKGIDARKPWKCFIQAIDKYPNSLFYEDNCLWLPNGASLTIEEQNQVIKCIQDFYNGI